MQVVVCVCVCAGAVFGVCVIDNEGRMMKLGEMWQWLVSDYICSVSILGETGSPGAVLIVGGFGILISLIRLY